MVNFRNKVLIFMVLFFAYWGNIARNTLEFSKELTFTDHTSCTTLRGPIGAEDLVRWNDFVLVSNLDALNLWEWSKRGDDISDPPAAQGGHIYAVSGIGSPDMSLAKAEFVGFPEGVAFHPHGLGWLGDLLFVVNHAYANGGERVDVFRIGQFEGKVQITYQFTTRFDECCMGILNDVLPVSEDEFYVTTYMPIKDETEGRRHGFTAVKQLLYMLSPFPIKKTYVYHCKGSGTVADVCKIVGPPGKAYNGITANLDKSKIYVNDLIIKTIYQFDRTEDGDLINPKAVVIPHMVDNIYFEEQDGKIWGSGIAKGVTGMKWLKDYINNPGVIPTGGSKLGESNCASHVMSLDFETGVATEEFMHDGSLLNCAAGVVKFGDFFLAGSFVDDGILICPLKK